MSVAGLQGHPLTTPVGVLANRLCHHRGVAQVPGAAEKTNVVGVLGSSRTARAGPETDTLRAA